MKQPKAQRLAVLFHRIGPYHFARLRAIGQRIPTIGVEISRSDDTYAWNQVQGAEGFCRSTLFETDVQTQPRDAIINRVHAALEECQPQAVAIPGWLDTAAFAALDWCLKRRVPAIAMSESSEWDASRNSIKEWIKKRVVGLYVAGLVGGQSHADYLARLGMLREQIFLGYDAVDNGYFETKSVEVRKQRAEVRERLKLPERFFLASARFVEKKNLRGLLQAYASYRRKVEGESQTSEIRGPKSEVSGNAIQGAPWSLVLLGDGPLKATLNSQLSTLNLHGHVLLPGFKQYDELPSYYGLASAFVHASTTEQWGLVVNEAMASELPVLVSNRCGCARDLVREGVNGFTFDPNNTEQLADLMLKLSTLNSQLSTLGAASREIVSQWGPERFADGLARATAMALQVGPRPASWLDRVLLRMLMARRG